mgnify:CR=1 FL=1
MAAISSFIKNNTNENSLTPSTIERDHENGSD